MSKRILPELDPKISKLTGKPFTCDQDAESYNQSSGFAVQQFRKDFPEFYGTPANSKTLLDWIEAHDTIISRFNLGVGYQDLLRDGKLETRPVETEDEFQSEPELDLSKLSFRQLKMLPRGPVKLSDVAARMTSKDTVKLNYTMPDSEAGRQLLEEEYQNRREMCEIGRDPRKTELGHQHRLSIQHEKAAKNANRADFLAARQRVILAHPEIPRDGTTFGRLVNEELSRE
jgi:hypothetical protein